MKTFCGYLLEIPDHVFVEKLENIFLGSSSCLLELCSWPCNAKSIVAHGTNIPSIMFFSLIVYKIKGNNQWITKYMSDRHVYIMRSVMVPHRTSVQSMMLIHQIVFKI